MEKICDLMKNGDFELFKKNIENLDKDILNSIKNNSLTQIHEDFKDSKDIDYTEKLLIWAIKNDKRDIIEIIYDLDEFDENKESIMNSIKYGSFHLDYPLYIEDYDVDTSGFVYQPTVNNKFNNFSFNIFDFYRAVAIGGKKYVKYIIENEYQIPPSFMILLCNYGDLETF